MTITNSQADGQEQPTRFLDVLSAVPHLASACAEQHLLRELRSICTEARRCSGGLITSLTLDSAFTSEAPFSDMQRSSLISLLKGSTLRRLCVVLHLVRKRTFEEDMPSIHGFLALLLSSVTQLAFHLEESPQVSLSESEAVITPAATALCLLATLCAPLTHIAVTMDGYPRSQHHPSSYASLMNAAAQVSATSLTHLTLDMRPRSYSGSDGLRFANQLIFSRAESYFLLYSSPVLLPLTHLKHLDLGDATSDMLSSYGCPDARVALPPSLESLHMLSLPSACHGSFALPNLLELYLEVCCCDSLSLLLQGSPLCCRLRLQGLYAPESVVEAEGLQYIIQHPAWVLANSGAPDCSPVTQFHQNKCWRGWSNRFGCIDCLTMLSALPVMPSITSVSMNFKTATGSQPLHEEMQVGLLHYFPRVFPNLQESSLDGILEADKDMIQLRLCTSLRLLKVRYSRHVSGEALLKLASYLPNLVSLEVGHCDLVSEEHRVEIAEMLKRNALA